MLIKAVVEFMTSSDLEIVDGISNWIGFSSISTSVVMFFTEWGLPQWGLMISLVGGILFAIEKIIMIYLRLKEAKKLDK